MEGRPRREIKLPAKFKEEEGPVRVKKKRSTDSSDGEEMDVDPKVYCICRKPYKEGDFMIHCDKCKEWFHGKCVNVMQKEAAKIKKYVCPVCLRQEGAKDNPAEAPLVLEEPSKIPKKHRSLETAKGERAHPKTAAKLVEGQPAGVARETAKSAEAQNLSGATKPSAPTKPTKPAKLPASAKPSPALKQSEAGPLAAGTGEEAGGVGAKPSEKAGKGGEKVGAKVADKAGNGKAAEGLAKGSEKVKAGAKEGTEAKEGEGAVRSIQRPKKDNLMCSACKKKGHIRTHRECPLYGQLLTPTEGKPSQGEAKKDMAAGPKAEKQKEVLPSDEDEPILSRKKGPPAQKAPASSGRPTAAPTPLPASTTPAGEDSDHAQMLHPVNTSSHFDTGATLLMPPEKPSNALEAPRAIPASPAGSGAPLTFVPQLPQKRKQRS